MARLRGVVSPALVREAGSPRSGADPHRPPGIQLVRQGKSTAFLDGRPIVSSANVRWRHVVLEDYKAPACLLARHEHPQVFLHVVLQGSVPYEVTTRGRTRRYMSAPGTTFLLPAGTVDEVNWEGPTHRLAMEIHPELLSNGMAENARETTIELREHWDLIDRQIQLLLDAMTGDLLDGSPAGRLYGESLANALGVYLVARYGVRRSSSAAPSGGLPGRRQRRVLDYIGDNLAEDLSLHELAEVAGMSPHYFAELFKQSMGLPPHSFVLSQRIERAKELLRDPGRSVIDAGLETGFQNPSHFSRTFKKVVGVTPSQFRKA